LVAKLRQRGLSIPRIAELLGVGEATVYRDLSGFPNEKPERPPESTGADGKTYPARQRTAPNARSWWPGSASAD
uniref:helix-turn-helix domain-containing protein n=1 Tax=Rhodothermus marinus TaxID=29549 RepID=UPI001FB39C21